jgi:hypothetical protein
LETSFNFSVEWNNGKLTVTVDSAVVGYDYSFMNQTLPLSFHAGNYCHDNTGNPNEGCIVGFNALSVQDL